jgi:hypothetical protein
MLLLHLFVPKIISEVNSKDLHVKNTWLAAYRKELKMLIVIAKTFPIEDLQDGEQFIPVLETNKTKYGSGLLHM